MQRQKKKKETHHQDQQLSKISFIVLIVDTVPQKCHVRSHKSRAEITNSSYLSCHSLHLLLYTICKSLLTFMYKYIQFIDYSRAGMVIWFLLLWLLCCWLRNISREIHTADVTSPNAAHAYCIMNTSRAHTEPNIDIYRNVNCYHTKWIFLFLRSHDCGWKRGNVPTTQEHRRHKCHLNLLPQRHWHVVCFIYFFRGDSVKLEWVTLSEGFLGRSLSHSLHDCSWSHATEGTCDQF